MWDYLIITASNEEQAAGYRSQLDLRRRLGLLTEVKDVLVVPDPQGRRIGSGGSTLFCLIEVLRHRLAGASADLGRCRAILSALRILIVHAGGDSKRLPAYGPCGKIFVPVPGESHSCLPMTLFDRQLPTYLALPALAENAGQVVIASGDVLLQFDPDQIDFSRPGLTGLGCYADPRQAAHHGVYGGVDASGRVRRFLQKPSVERQQQLGAIDHYGQSVLDIGLMSFDADTAVRLLEISGFGPDGDGTLRLSGEMGRAVMERGLDFYREICCGLGTETDSAHHIENARRSGSTWDDVLLDRLLQGLRDIDFNLQLLRRCRFIDFGTSRQILRSGTALMQQDRGAPRLHSCLDINNDMDDDGRLIGPGGWVEGCRLRAPLTLTGDNVLVGLDIDEPLSPPAGACLDVLAGGEGIWFVRCCGIDDTFKETAEAATFCGMPVLRWLEAVEASPEDAWDGELPPAERSVWNARLFPVVSSPDQYRRWLWMFDPAGADAVRRAGWKAARRVSSAEIARLADPDAFFRRRLAIRSDQIKNSLRNYFRRESELSADELVCILQNSADRTGWIAALIGEAKWYDDSGRGMDTLAFSRILHTMAAVLESIFDADAKMAAVLPDLPARLAPAERDWLSAAGLSPDGQASVGDWAHRARRLAFDSLGRAILYSGPVQKDHPVSRLRSDEIVWGRAPARFDTGGGWTDTPPYSLEHGGCVVNTAVNLNGQAPIQAYARVTEEPAVTIGSIDLGTRIRVTELDQLLDYAQPTSQYGLVKAALALSGFSPRTADWPQGASLEEMLRRFGGGIEITTLAAIPKGSGLGTSSIMGAVLLAVIHRVMGRTLTPRQLFNKVLQLEQGLTTGGGWQDQVGGALGGVKIVYADAGLVPDIRVHYLPDDLLDPAANGGLTLLYYTGITRLAKNILEQVVGRYLDRSRRSLATLRRIHGLTGPIAEALSRKDLPAFGRLVDGAWQLNKQLDPNSTSEPIEVLFDRVAPHVHGAKLLGAGGGGFMLMVCKSPADARRVREMLESDPPNERGRFFDYSVNREGLVVTVC